MNTAIVLGVGAERGVGAQLCLRLSELSLHVLVAGRTQEKLDHIANIIAKNGGSARPVICDASQEDEIQSLFDSSENPIEIAIYNAGNATPGKLGDMTAAYFEQSWRVICFGAFVFGREAVKNMKPRGSGTLLFTGASASLRGNPNFGAFSSAKGAKRNLAQAFAKEYGPEGIHVGHIIIDGAIDGDYVADKFPEFSDFLSEGGVSIEGIVDSFIHLHKQKPRSWTFELDLRTSIENW